MNSNHRNYRITLLPQVSIRQSNRHSKSGVFYLAHCLRSQNKTLMFIEDCIQFGLTFPQLQIPLQNQIKLNVRLPRLQDHSCTTELWPQSEEQIGSLINIEPCQWENNVCPKICYLFLLLWAFAIELLQVCLEISQEDSSQRKSGLVLKRLDQDSGDLHSVSTNSMEFLWASHLVSLCPSVAPFAFTGLLRG